MTYPRKLEIHLCLFQHFIVQDSVYAVLAAGTVLLQYNNVQQKLFLWPVRNKSKD